MPTPSTNVPFVPNTPAQINGAPIVAPCPSNTFLGQTQPTIKR